LDLDIRILPFFKNLGCENEIDDVYFPGIINIKANNDFPNGMIVGLDAFYLDEDLESLNRAIIYKHDSQNIFDLGDTVVYKISEPCFDDCGILLATDIEKNNFFLGNLNDADNSYFSEVRHLFGDSIDQKVDFISLNQSYSVGTYIFKIENNVAVEVEEYDLTKYASKKLLYSMKNHYRINLHQSDPHREGPFHIRKHIRRPKTLLGQGNLPDEVLKVVVMEDDIGNETIYIINDPFNVAIGEANEYYLYYKRSIRFSNINTFYPDVNNVEDSKVYDISTTHDHTYSH